MFNFSDLSFLYFVCFQVWSVPEVLRPLYESSKILAQKLTIAVRLIICIDFIQLIMPKLITNPFKLRFIGIATHKTDSTGIKW
jgi:hypothetical protein